MQLDIHTTDGGNLHIEDFEPETLIDILDDIRAGEPLLTFALDDGMAYIPTAAITRIDSEHRPRGLRAKLQAALRRLGFQPNPRRRT